MIIIKPKQIWPQPFPRRHSLINNHFLLLQQLMPIIYGELLWIIIAQIIRHKSSRVDFFPLAREIFSQAREFFLDLRENKYAHVI